MTRPRVSIVIPAFNAEKYINQAIQSVLDQSYSDFELVVIDDGSNDATWDVISSFNDSRVRKYRHALNMGVCHARNTGLLSARGEWITFLDADDLWHKKRLEILLNIAQKDAGRFIGSNSVVCCSSLDGVLIPWKIFYNLSEYSNGDLYQPKIEDLFKYGLASTFPIIPLDWIKKNRIEFRQEYRGHDWLIFILHLIQSGLVYCISHEELYFWRLDPSSSSNSLLDITTQIESYEYIRSLNWISASSLKYLDRAEAISKYRRVPAAVREGRWGLALKYLITYPMSGIYLLFNIRNWRKGKRERLKLILNKRKY